jgi:hypothetical protein
MVQMAVREEDCFQFQVFHFERMQQAIDLAAWVDECR